MKRSEINNYLRWAVDLMDKYQFKLPRFAYWSMDEWKENKDKNLLSQCQFYFVMVFKKLWKLGVNFFPPYIVLL